MTKGPKNGLSYRDAGVDVDAGNALVDAIKPLARRTDRSGVMASLGGFGALFDLRQAGYADPILVSGTDGVGTKLKIAIDSGIHNLLGIDLVAMCVNDLVVQGAEPLFFLDYFATGRLNSQVAARVVEGIAEGCVTAGCALIGGETAEMPGVYADGDYDLAGFAVGAVERTKLLTGDQVQSGDVLLGLASSGLHSNGFSLVRRVVETRALEYGAPAPFATGQSLAEALLTPTRIYVKSCLAALGRHSGVHALCHVTGGGFIENLPRVLPDELAVRVDVRAWPLPPVFSWLAEAGGIAPLEMARVFNCGIGMVAVVAETDAQDVTATLEAAGETVWPIGRVIAADGGDRVIMEGIDQSW